MYIVLFVQVFISFFLEQIFLRYRYTQELLHHRAIGNIDPHASNGNAVAGKTVEVWGMADEFRGSVTDGFNSENNKQI